MEEKLTIKEKIAKLIDVKTLVTLSLTAAFVYLAVTNQIETLDFKEIFTIVIVFYFGTQSGKQMSQ
mgnify:CR=1 FL=1